MASRNLPWVQSMRLVPTRVHGVLDYLTGALLIIAPFIFGFNTGGPEQWVPMVLGAAAIVYSLATRYELGLFPAIPMPVHLMLDAGSGLILLLSPWLFGFADVIVWPHVVVGVFEIVMSVITETRPGRLRKSG